MSIFFLFIFTWCWAVIMLCAWQGNIHWCELNYLRDGSRIEKAYIEKGRSGVNNLWQVQCQWGHQIGTETSFLCFHPSRCHRLEGDAFSVSAVRLLNVMRSAFALALAVADMLCQLSGSYGMPRGILGTPAFIRHDSWHPNFVRLSSGFEYRSGHLLFYHAIPQTHMRQIYTISM